MGVRKVRFFRSKSVTNLLKDLLRFKRLFNVFHDEESILQKDKKVNRWRTSPHHVYRLVFDYDFFDGIVKLYHIF